MKNKAVSIKKEIDGDYIANGIRMDSFNGYYVLVEGDNDELFYAKFLNDGNVQIEICHGKENVLEAIQILDTSKATKKYLALVDKDYDFLHDEIFESPNLIRTDFHDIETMCISSEAFDNFSNEYLKKSKVEKICSEKSKSIKEHLFDMAIPIAKVRILNTKKQYCLKFKPSGLETKELEYTKFICKDTFEFLGMDNLMNTLKRYFNQGLPKNNEEIIKEIESLDLSKYEILDIVHGHDLTNIIVIGLKKAIGKSSLNNAKRDEVERSLRLAYSKEEFSRTFVYRKIREVSKDLLKE